MGAGSCGNDALLRDWTIYEAVGLSVAYMVLGFACGYAFSPVAAFLAKRIRRRWGRIDAD